jgi:hypothetical protein
MSKGFTYFIAGAHPFRLYWRHGWVFSLKKKRLKISTPQYFLPTVEALVPGQVLESGRTRPQIVTGICQTSFEKDDYVVKFIKSPEMTPEKSSHELIASFIALELDLNVPEPALMNVSNNFVAAMNGNQNYHVASNSVGVNFCSKYVTNGFQSLIKGQKLTGPIIKKLACLFAFDLLISNADRRIDKHNFSTNGKDILILDHEAAFGYVYDLPFTRNKEPWIIREQEMQWVETNFCYQALRGKRLGIDEFISKFVGLNEGFWRRAVALVPPAWNSHLSEIKATTDLVVANVEIFHREIQRILK